MKKLFFILSVLILFHACGKDTEATTPPSNTQSTPPSNSTDNTSNNTEVTTVEKFDLAVSSSEGGSVDTSGGSYDSNSSVTIKATPTEGYLFTGWSGSYTSINNSLSLVMDESKTIKANFEQIIDVSSQPDVLFGNWSFGSNDSSSSRGECNLLSIIFRKNETFTVLTSTSSITGQFLIESNTTIRLSQNNSAIGSITNLIITNSFISLSIELENNCQEDTKGNKDVTYDENTDPLTTKIFLAANGVTIKCPDAEVGDKETINGKEYTVVDRATLTDMIAKSEDVTCVCTTKLTTMYQMFSSSSFNQDIGSWDTSNVHDWTGMFYLASSFNQDISSWDTSSASDMRGVFNGASSFNQNIGGWNTSSVTRMNDMFEGATAFNQDIGDWDTAAVTNMTGMFYRASSFNQDIGDWDTAAVTDMSAMFKNAQAFNGDIGNWNTAAVTDMSYMFQMANAFNQNIGSWNTSAVTTMAVMFAATPTWSYNVGNLNMIFNQDIGSWDTAAVTNMNKMFKDLDVFNQDLSGWCVTNITTEPSDFSLQTDANKPVWGTCPEVTNTDTTASIYFENNTCKCPQAVIGDTASINGVVYTVVDNSTIAGQIGNNNINLCTTLVTNMSELFENNDSFNLDIGFWDTSNVTNMSYMFSGSTAFNQNIGSWDTSSVTNMNGLFNDATAFNQDIGNWITSSAIEMNGMFSPTASFNQDIGNWDTSKVTDMSYMFNDATVFNQDIGNWDTSKVTDMSYIFYVANSFNQNLSGWCVTNITSEPIPFSDLSPLSNANKPVWGTCPATDSTNSNQAGTVFSIDVTATSSADYTLSGTDRNEQVSGNDPTVTIKIGDTVNFAVNASGHPFYLKTVQGTGTANTISGVTNNGTTSGTVSWTPTQAGTYYYICSLHGGMVGIITVQQ